MNIDMTFDELYNRTFEISKCDLVRMNKGDVYIRTIVNETDINPYGKAHGGYLYTLCDSMAGLVGYSLGSYTVSLQGNINYIKEAKLNDTLHIYGTYSHDGKTTKVADVLIKNQDDKIICKSTFTLFVIKQVEDKKQ